MEKGRWSGYYTYESQIISAVDIFFDDRLIVKKHFDYGYATTLHKS